MVPRENKNNAYAKFGGTNKEYYGIFPKWPIIGGEKKFNLLPQLVIHALYQCSGS